MRRENYDKAAIIINRELKEILSTVDETVNNCIYKIKEYVKKGLRSELIRSLNNLASFFQFLLRQLYDRVKRRLWGLGFRTPEIIFMILDYLMPWIANTTDRVRGIIKTYENKLGIKDFSISMSISGPFVQVTFGISITFYL